WESSRPNIQGFQGKADLPWVSRGLRGGRNAYPMDSRFRFLHPLWTELRGHGEGSGAGSGKPGASEVVLGLEKPPHKRRRRDAERNKVAKPRPLPVEKSRYGSIRARTVNRHRWMRRGS